MSPWSKFEEAAETKYSVVRTFHYLTIILRSRRCSIMQHRDLSVEMMIIVITMLQAPPGYRWILCLRAVGAPSNGRGDMHGAAWLEAKG
jgi:hypothetical protein